MKMITTDNYEALLLQYHEGLLDEGQQREVETFLREHPDISDADEWCYSRVVAESVADGNRHRINSDGIYCLCRTGNRH